MTRYWRNTRLASLGVIACGLLALGDTQSTKAQDLCGPGWFCVSSCPSNPGEYCRDQGCEVSYGACTYGEPPCYPESISPYKVNCNLV